ncbi:unnamed protein product [Paramecium sonneborni]|uniref:Transmembrane protein n=1 Tax=Paramecium sonneborni TaxID=65129 RepID=A0A8S1QE71_9CILI|nr:unnamed protein product [Paramecium sonneborni]
MPETKMRQIQFPQNFASILQMQLQKRLHSFRINTIKMMCFVQFYGFKIIQSIFKSFALTRLQIYIIMILLSVVFRHKIKQLVTYLKVSGYIFDSLLQICNDFLRVIYYYQQINESRYMQEELQQKLKEYISEIEEQIAVESTQIWLSGTDFELQMIKIGREHLGTNSETGTTLMKAVLFGIVSSISQLKPSEELIDSLMKAGQFLLLNFYNKYIKNPLKIYELYFFFEILKWFIIFQLKDEYSVQQTIKQLTEGYKQYIEASQSCLIHFYLLFSKAQVAQKMDLKTSWNLLFVQNLIVAVPYVKLQGKIKYSGRGLFILKEFSNLKLFQEYLLSEQISSLKLLPYIQILILYHNLQAKLIQKTQIQACSQTQMICFIKNLLQSCQIQIKENFNQINSQARLFKNQMENKLGFKICRQDIQDLVNQQKEQFLQLLQILNEIDIIRIKEIEIMNNLEQILIQNEIIFYKFSKNRNTYKYLLLMKFEQNLKINSSSNFNKFQTYGKYFILKTIKIKLKQLMKKLIKKIYLRLYIHRFCQSMIKNQKLVQNSLMICYLILSLKQNQQKNLLSKLTLKNHLQFLKTKSLQKKYYSNLQKIYPINSNKFILWIGLSLKLQEIILMFKFYKKLLRIQQSKINVLQLEHKIQDFYFDDQIHLNNNIDSDSTTTQLNYNLVSQGKTMIQKYFDQYPTLIMNKQKLTELNYIENKIREDIFSLKNKKWNSRNLNRKYIYYKRLTQLGLNKIQKKTLKEAINQNFASSLKILNRKLEKVQKKN